MVFPTKSKQIAKAKLASTTSSQKTKENLIRKPSAVKAKSNKWGNTAISKTVNKELLKKQSSWSESNEEVFATKIKQLTAENAALHKANAMKENVSPMIPWPEKGSAGNGFSLWAKMGLADDDELYGALWRCVQDAVNKAGLDYRIKWHCQLKHLIAQVIGVAWEHHEYIKQFPHGWAIEEFIKSSLKNKSAYAHKQGYFQELGNANNAGRNGREESLNGDMGDDKAEARNGEFEGNVEDEELEAENGEFKGDMEDDKAEAGNGEFKGNNEEDA